jgi:hypothetical protein
VADGSGEGGPGSSGTSISSRRGPSGTAGAASAYSAVSLPLPGRSQLAEGQHWVPLTQARGGRRILLCTCW